MRRPHINLLRRIGEHAAPGGEASSAMEILGANHPLVRVVDLRRDMHRQSLATAVAVVIGMVGFAFGTRWGLPLLIAAALIQLVLGAGIALLAQLQHVRALDLIIEGLDGLPLPALERERRRLQRPRRRAGHDRTSRRGRSWGSGAWSCSSGRQAWTWAWSARISGRPSSSWSCRGGSGDRRR